MTDSLTPETEPLNKYNCQRCNGTGDEPEASTNPDPHNAALLRVYELADELCTAIDCEAEDIGGQRGQMDIVRDLGPATDAVRVLINGKQIATNLIGRDEALEGF